MKMVNPKEMLTKMGYLMLCHDMWRWLEKHPGKSKTNYPRFKFVSELFDGIASDQKDVFYGLIKHGCYTCEYTKNTYSLSIDSELDCKQCPLRTTWRGKCEDSRSPYANWKGTFLYRESCPASKEELRKSAKRIADGAAREVKKEWNRMYRRKK